MNFLSDELATLCRGFSSRRAMIVYSTVTLVVSTSALSCDNVTGASNGKVITAVVTDMEIESFVGDTVSAIVYAYNGQKISAKDPRGTQVDDLKYKWSSSNPAVAEIVPNTNATSDFPDVALKSIGNASLFVSVNDTRVTLAPGVGEASIPVKVGERPIGVRLVPNGGTIREGQVLVMRPELKTASGQPTYGERWVFGFSCLDPSIAFDETKSPIPADATICGDWTLHVLNLKGRKAGTTKIVAIYVTGSLRFEDTVAVTVLPLITATRVTVSPLSVSLVAGATRQLTATVYDQSNAVINGAAVQWLPKDVSVASVSAQGLLKGESTNGADSAKVQITAKAAEGVEATLNATIYRAVANVLVSPNPKTMQVGSTHQFAYELKASNGNNIPLNATSVTWATGDQSIATINQAGLVTAVAVGRTTVRVTTAEGVAGVADLTVEAIPVSPVTRVVVTPAIITLKLTDAKCQFSAKAFDANGNEVVVPGFRWIIDDSTVGSVDATGLVTFKKAGTTAVRAFFGNASDAPGGFGTLTVTP